MPWCGKSCAELRDFDNVYYEICNEPYFQGVTLEWQEHISRTIAGTEEGFAKKHLIAQNWANGSSVVDRPNPLVSLFNFHYSRPPASVAMNWKLNRAIGNNETGFDGAADATYRIQGWEFLMAGGALYNNLDYSFTVGHEDGTFEPPPATPGGGSAALRRQLRYLRAFFDEIPFWRMQPAGESLVLGPEGASARALEEPGKLYAIYIHHGRVVKDGKPRFQVDGSAMSRQFTLQLPRGRLHCHVARSAYRAGRKEGSVRGIGSSRANPAEHPGLQGGYRVGGARPGRAGATVMNFESRCSAGHSKIVDDWDGDGTVEERLQPGMHRIARRQSSGGLFRGAAGFGGLGLVPSPGSLSTRWRPLLPFGLQPRSDGKGCACGCGRSR